MCVAGSANADDLEAVEEEAQEAEAPDAETPEAEAPEAETPEAETPEVDAEGTQGGASPAEMRRSADASVDRNILMPSAETISEGDVTFNSYELLLAGVTYGATDDIAISLTALLPITSDFPVFASLSGKVRLYAGSNDILSLQQNLMSFGVDGESAGIIGAHLLYDHIFDDSGRYTLTLAMSTLGVLGATGGDVDLADGAVLGFSGAFSAHVGSFVKLMGELYLPGAITPDTTELVQEALLFNYGVRFFSSSIAVDLTFLRPIHPDADSAFVMGVPFVTFSARF